MFTFVSWYAPEVHRTPYSWLAGMSRLCFLVAAFALSGCDDPLITGDVTSRLEVFEVIDAEPSTGQLGTIVWWTTRGGAYYITANGRSITVAGDPYAEGGSIIVTTIPSNQLERFEPGSNNIVLGQTATNGDSPPDVHKTMQVLAPCTRIDHCGTGTCVDFVCQ